MPSYPVAIFPNIWGEIPACLDKKRGGATVCNWLSRRGGVQLVVRGPQGPGYTTLQIQQILQYNSEDYYSEKKTSLMVLFSFFFRIPSLFYNNNNYTTVC